MNYIKPEKQYTWVDRLRNRLLPWEPCELPEAPASFKDVLVSRTRSSLSFTDRIRVLITGRIEVETRTVTENEIGNHKTASILRAGRFTK